MQLCSPVGVRTAGYGYETIGAGPQAMKDSEESLWWGVLGWWMEELGRAGVSVECTIPAA